eukprot:5118159-Pyramimonas_sp.AAC.1
MYNKSERIAIEHERKNAEQMKVLQQKVWHACLRSRTPYVTHRTCCLFGLPDGTQFIDVITPWY